MALRIFAYLESLSDKRGFALLGHSLLVFSATWVVGQLLSFAIAARFPGDPNAYDIFADGRRGILIALLLGPLLETLAMRGVFWLLRRLRQKRAWILVWSTLFWWLSHMPAENWGVPAALVFWVMAVLYFSFEKRSTDWAMIYVSLFHMAFNGLAFVLYWYMYG